MRNSAIALSNCEVPPRPTQAALQRNTPLLSARGAAPNSGNTVPTPRKGIAGVKWLRYGHWMPPVLGAGIGRLRDNTHAQQGFFP
jgi:hypothetical protein